MRGRIITVVCAVAVLAAACGSSSRGKAAAPNRVPERGRPPREDDRLVPRGRRRGEGQRLRPRRDSHQPGHDGAVGRTRAAARTTSCPPTPTQDFGETFGVAADKFTPGTDYEFRFDKPGVYRYYCSLHGSKTKGMIGEIVVGDVDADRRRRPRRRRRRATRRHAARPAATTRRSRRRSTPRSRAASCSCRPASTRKRSRSRPTNLVIRGLDRTGTVLDGAFTRDNGIKVLADGVAIENMTARNYTAQRLLLDRREGLPRLVSHRDPQRRLRHLRVRLDLRPVRPRLRRGQPRRGLLHRPVLPVPRGDHRFDLGVERHRLLGHERGRRTCSS